MKYVLLFITIIFLCSCEESDEKDNFNADDMFIHHQIIINNPDDLGGAFYLYSSAGHHYGINPSDSINVINGTFGTPLKDWDPNSPNYMVMFYYTGIIGFGCINVEINTFIDFELYHTNNFIVGKLNNDSFCAWNENSFQYSILIDD